MPELDYIQLDRRFAEIPKDPEDAQRRRELELYAMFTNAQATLGWPELLEKPRVVVLGEPGSGKTAEFREQARSLKLANKITFLIDLQRLIAESIDDILTVSNQREAFNAWLKTSQPAWFFLDSVDESRLKSRNDFDWALKKFRSAFDDAALARARILLSSRVSSWRFETDLPKLAEALTPKRAPEVVHTHENRHRGRAETIAGAATNVAIDADPPQGQDEYWSPAVFGMAPLTLDQVERFVEGKAADGKEFRRALEGAYLEAFARRPLDVRLLLRYWQENRRFGSLMEMTESAITDALTESNLDAHRSHLSPAKVREGIEDLAAGVLLCRKRDLLKALPCSDQGETGAVKPDKILSESWRPEEIAELLDRSYFEPPMYGRLRFHHRTLEEYLAARWLLRLHAHNLPDRALKQILFKDVPGEALLLRPSMAPIAAWMASMDGPTGDLVRSLVKSAEPELFFRAGDPANLSVAYVRDLLNALIKQYQEWGVVRLEVDRSAITRLARSDLGGFLSEKLLDKSIASSLRDDLMHLATAGRVRGCEREALQLIRSGEESTYLRSAACRYLRAVDAETSLQGLADTVGELRGLDQSLVAAILIACFPKYLSNEKCIELLLSLDSVPERTTTLSFRLHTYAKESLADSECVRLIEALVDALRIGPPWEAHIGESFEIGAKYMGLAQLIHDLLPLAVREHTLTREEAMICARAVFMVVGLASFGHIRDTDERELSIAASASPELRRAFMQESFSRLQRAGAPTTERLTWSLAHHSVELGVVGEADVGWLCDLLSEGNELTTQHIALVLQMIWSMVGRPRRMRRDIRTAARSVTPAIRSTVMSRFPGRLELVWNRIRLTFQPGFRRLFWTRRVLIPVRKRTRWFRAEVQLLLRLNKIRRGENLNAIWFVINEQGLGDHLSEVIWQRIESRRGLWVARAVRNGVTAFWPQFSPELWFERSNGESSIDVRNILGLIGISEALNRQALDLHTIGTDEVVRLSRYALNEINGFPEWFSALVEAHPRTVIDALSDVLHHEWNITKAELATHHFLATLSYHQSPAYITFLDPILIMLERSDPKNPVVLQQVLRFLSHWHEHSADRLVGLAPGRCAAYTLLEEHHLLWMALWLRLSPVLALDYLEPLWRNGEIDGAYLERLAGMLSPLAHLDNPRWPDVLYRSSESLHRLAVLYYEAFPPMPEVPRESGVSYGRSRRDETVEFRAQLVGALAENDDPVAGFALRDLSERDAAEAHRDWLRYLGLRRSRRCADEPPWGELEVRDYQERHETDPRNGMELFQLVLNHLLDVKRWVEHGEDSPRYEIHSQNDEREIRIWMAAKLRNRARGLYVVPEEHELANRRREDIRVEQPGISDVTVIELKQVEGWSMGQLEERLENQLIGDYLQLQGARYGIFLLSYSSHDGKRAVKRHPRNRRMLDFGAIVEHLQRRADELTAGSRGLIVKVVGVDFVTR